MDILTIMDLAAEVEEGAADLYHTYSQRFFSTPEGYAFWEELCREEKRHADTARTYRRRRVDLPFRTSMQHPELIADLWNIKRYLRRQMERDPQEEYISNSLQVAYRLETMMAHAHLHHLSEIGDPLLTRLMMKLGDADHAHQEKIKVLARAFPSGD